MKVNVFLWMVGLGAAGLWANTDRPNVIVFLVDDLGYYDLSITGSAVYETPHIDRLAREAASCEQGYAAFPRCVPSRFGLMTGIHPSRAESEGEVLTEMSPARLTLAEVMQASGYATFFAGKWHLGKTASAYPQSQGFDINIGGGSAGAPGTYFWPFTTKNLEGPEQVSGKPGDYITDRLTDETVAFIEAHASEPFFVYLSHYGVHTPFESHEDKTAKYKGKLAAAGITGPAYAVTTDGRALTEQSNAVYAGMVESVDDSLGRLVDTLQRLGLYDRTIIVFTSDHGGLSHSGLENKRPLATTNRPLRAGKGHLYEGGLRVPVIIRWPGVADDGRGVRVPFVGIDLFPTVMEMSGIPADVAGVIDGVSYAPVLMGTESQREDRAYFWYSDRGRPSSTGDYNAAVIRKGSYKLLEFFTQNRLELYHLEDDPSETRNLSETLPDIRDALYAELKAWKVRMKVKDRSEPRQYAY